MKMWSAFLDPKSPRFETWAAILGDGRGLVPLISSRIQYMNLGGTDFDTPIYMLDVAAMTPDQRARLVDWIAGKIEEDRNAIALELDRGGFPIRVADVIVDFAFRGLL